jgi:AraC-like DNA-binding protein
MSYRYLKVNPLLSEYIRTVLILDDTPETHRNQLPLFTAGTPVFICRIANDTVLQLTLYGKSAPSENWEVKQKETLIAYLFKPFSMACLFNIPASVLVKGAMKLSTWDTHKTHALTTQLASSQDGVEKISALDQLLLRQLELQHAECKIVRHATDALLLHSGKEVLAGILTDLSLNERTFQRIFKKFVGVTPTQYRRICQFKASFDQVKRGQFDKLADVAYDAGFADQSHFIRSFKEHTQTTPKDYVKSGLKKQ